MKIAIVQISSVLDAKENLEKLDSFIKEAAEGNASAVFLPEVFLSMSDGKPTPFMANDFMGDICALAKKHNVYILGGTAATRVDDKIMNRAYNIAPTGELINFYDKRHVFKCTLPNQEIDEGKVYSTGDKDCVVEIDDLKIGFNICVDLRYPKLFTDYRDQGCQLISCSSAFTKKTGQAHWHTLLKARAIENQCYIVAANQYGKHNDKMETYGHSLIIDPWGDVIADAEEGEKVIYGNIDLDFVKEVRQRVTM